MSDAAAPSPLVVVTGANGLVGSRICTALTERGARVRAVVRRSGAAPRVPGGHELVGDFTDPAFAAEAVERADAVVATVHPMGSDLATQRRVGVEGTATLARAAAAAGVRRLVYLSTASVYDRSPATGDVDETGRLVGDDAGPYALTKRDAEAALAHIPGSTRVLLRPPAILGSGESSVWNSVVPAAMAEHEQARHTRPQQTFAWIHVDDLAAFAGDLATGRIATAAEPGTGDGTVPERGTVPEAGTGPEAGGCTPVNVAAGPATTRDYYGRVAHALGVEPVWEDEPAWTGQLLTARARSWGFAPRVTLRDALAELDAGLREGTRR